MLSYKLKQNAINPTTNTPMRDYLYSLGIRKVESFINTPPKEDELSPWLLDNMDKCVDELHEAFTHDKKFFLQVDSDCDGLTSATIFYRFFKGYYPNAQIIWRLHDGKEHGVILSTVPDETDIIILPDSGSMQLEEQEILANKGKKVIIMDHHNVTNMFKHPNIILVNNQISENFTNKALSGAGVVFKVIQAYAEKYPNMYVKPSDFYDVASLGLLADMMSMLDLDNNYIVYQGLHNIKNELIKAILEKQSFSIKDINNPTKIDMVFYVAPLINATIRAGSPEEKELLFKAFIEEPTDANIVTTWRGQERNETFYQYVARTISNIRGRQNTEKEKCFDFLKNKIIDDGLDKNQIIVVITSKDDKVSVPQNITGLIAMELLKYFGKPVLVLRPKIEDGRLVYAGSGRGKIADGFTSFLQFVRDSEHSEYGEGHGMAFGACIPADHLDAFVQESNEKLRNVNFNNEFVEVDAIFNNTDINYHMLYEFGKYNYIYGNSIPEPRIAIETIVNKDQVMIMGKDQSSVRITIGRLPCIKFKDKNLIEALTNCNRGKIKLIGRPQINEWMGNESVQLFIDSIEIEPLTTKSLF